jgi:hypothetical protein
VLFPDDDLRSRVTCLISDPHDKNTHDSATSNSVWWLHRVPSTGIRLPFDTLIKRNEWLRPPKPLLLGTMPNMFTTRAILRLTTAPLFLESPASVMDPLCCGENRCLEASQRAELRGDNAGERVRSGVEYVEWFVDLRGFVVMCGESWWFLKSV